MQKKEKTVIDLSTASPQELYMFTKILLNMSSAAQEHGYKLKIRKFQTIPRRCPSV